MILITLLFYFKNIYGIKSLYKNLTFELSSYKIYPELTKITHIISPTYNNLSLNWLNALNHNIKCTRNKLELKMKILDFCLLILLITIYYYLLKI
jgi:hypothetical protein